MRLQKYLAQAGVASRRKSEEYITQGRVSVNGQIVTELGTVIAPEKDTILFDKQTVKPEKTVVILFYKPPHVMCTNNDPQERVIVADYFKELKLRLYTVGRLDYDSEGLLLVTNDGDLANLLMHPRHEIQKLYYAICRGRVTKEDINQLKAGIMLDGEKTAPAKVALLDADDFQSRLLVSIHEGRNRQIRRMLDAIGHEVKFLRRDEVGFLTLEDLQPGEWRYLSEGEIEKLKNTAERGR